MALEDLTGTKYIGSLVATNPAAGDSRVEGDDHLRGIKNVLLLSFPSITGAVTATHTELNYCDITTLGTGQASKALTADASAVVDASALTFSDLGSVTTCDINGGTVDGVTIGAAVAPTVTNLGSVATADINGGTIDGVTIGATVAPTVTGAALGTAVTAVTQSVGDSSTAIATTAFVAASNELYESTGTTAITGGDRSYSEAHGLTGFPRRGYGIYLVCVTDDKGYVAGEEIDFGSMVGASTQAGQTWANATHVGVTCQNVFTTSITALMAHKTTGVLGSVTLANWEWKIRAEY